ncbi:MAG TPA: peptidyl-prolyl cis-trans isomerase [Patescibacteria group bacterium]|jgi:hypothetical protein|nr:peptidyl-prolyl cis-trans isomerase [Patescibacteria group bacterium]
MNKNTLFIILIIVCLAVAGYFYNKRVTVFSNQGSQVSSEMDTGAAETTLPGKPLVTMNGKVIITVDSLELEKEKIFQANPQLKKLSAYMNINQSLLYGLTSQAVMDQYIQESGIKNTDSYKIELEAAYKDVLRMINTKYFSQKYPSNVPETDVKKFYEENKDLSPNFIITKGGVRATEVLFDQEAQAIAFAQKVKTKGGNVLAAAQENGIDESKIKDLRLVHDQSIAIDQSVKDAIMGMTQFPTVLTVKTTENKYAVVVGTGREETKYRPYEQIKDQLKEYLDKEKQAEAIEKAIEELKKTYNVIVDESFFGSEKDNSNPDLGDLSQIDIENEEAAENALGA